MGAVFAHEHRLVTLARRGVARQTDGLALLVFAHHLGRPVRHGVVAPQQFGGIKADHLAKRWIHIGDAPLQIARPQAGDQRVFHRFAKSQGFGQITLGSQATARVFDQQHQHRHQRHRHGGDQGGEHVRKQIGRAAPSIDPQLQGQARQVQKLLRREQSNPSAMLSDDGQPRTIGFGKGDFIASRKLRAQMHGQNFLQAVGGDRIAHRLSRHHLGQAQVHDFKAQAFVLRHEIAV